MELSEEVPINTAVGIDLGTTNSCIAAWNGKQIRVLHNEYGSNLTPSYVAFDENRITFGQAAKDGSVFNPKGTVFNVKRLIGRKFDEVEGKMNDHKWPFEVLNRSGKPIIRVDYREKLNEYSPEEISAKILGKLKQQAEFVLGHSVKDAVITVPAHFNCDQRKATKDAGIISGFNVLRITSEPTAAALAYGFENRNHVQRRKFVLVYDLGGGTLDVSVLSIDSNKFIVMATTGEANLGGEDFDNNLVDYCASSINISLQENVYQHPQALCRLRKECERAKFKLSYELSTVIALDYIIKGKDIRIFITRAMFEEINQDLFKRTLPPITQVLRDAGVAVKDINEIVMVGGSTRIPKIQSLVKDYFKDKQLNNSMNPDEVVAYGAAVQASFLNQCLFEEFKDFKLYDVTPLSIGTDTIDNMMQVIIPRNSTVPIEISMNFKTVKDYQKSMTCRIYEGERTLANKNHLIGEFPVKNLSPAKRGQIVYKYTFSIDVNGILSVKVEELTTGKLTKKHLNLSDRRLPKEKIEHMLKVYKENVLQDKIDADRIKAMVEFEDQLFKLRDEIEDVDGCYRARKNKDELLRILQEELDWIKKNRLETKTFYSLRSQKLQEIFKVE